MAVISEVFVSITHDPIPVPRKMDDVLPAVYSVSSPDPKQAISRRDHGLVPGTPAGNHILS